MTLGIPCERCGGAAVVLHPRARCLAISCPDCADRRPAQLALNARMARAIVVGLAENWGEVELTTRAPCAQHSEQCEPEPRGPPWRAIVTSTGYRCAGR